MRKQRETHVSVITSQVSRMKTRGIDQPASDRQAAVNQQPAHLIQALFHECSQLNTTQASAMIKNIAHAAAWQAASCYPHAQLPLADSADLPHLCMRQLAALSEVCGPKHAPAMAVFHALDLHRRP